jgi:phage tail sheath protein FI
LRLCAARADVLALLALPDHYREADCLAYAQRLRELATLDGATSFGALFHPWTVVGTEPPRLAPADGAAAGLAARQASGPGAWISLANQPLQRVLGLDPILDAPGRAERCEARLNEIVPAPRGHLLLTAQTLSVGEALRPLSVRQLMSLVRRLAIREGSRHVFEPNGRALRRQVVGHFTRVLSELWRRGALAGSTASEAFRVTAGPRTTTSRDIDAGRFVVELRVAPSRPLEFLLICLIAATDNESISVQET